MSRSSAIEPRAVATTSAAPREWAEPARYRDFMSGFPSGVSVVTTVDLDGRPRGVTCSSLSSVTLTPPTLLVCLRKGSATLRAMCRNGAFAVNLLHSRGRDAAVALASAVPDRFAHVAWRLLETSKLPYLSRDAFAVASCQLAGRFGVGDHDIVLGRVFDIRLSPDTPLLYGLRRYSVFDSDVEFVAGESDEAG